MANTFIIQFYLPYFSLNRDNKYIINNSFHEKQPKNGVVNVMPLGGPVIDNRALNFIPVIAVSAPCSQHAGRSARS